MNKDFLKSIKFLGLCYDNVTLDETVGIIEDYVRLQTPHMIFTTGAELIVQAQKDEYIKNVYNANDILTIDSIVGYYAVRLLGKKIKEPVSAVRLTLRFLELNAEKGYRFYILGARKEILNKAVSNLKQVYPRINIVGYHDGYFDLDNDETVINEIIQVKPDILLVAMSSPLKEKFISKNYKKINVPVSIGVGGTIDIIAGKYKLAPEWISTLGLEWFYRFIQEPLRLWKRYLVTNLLFIYLVIKSLLKRSNK